jgi:hypothetical protein
MSTVTPVHEDVHQRAQQQDAEWQPLEDVGRMLKKQIQRGDRAEGQEDQAGPAPPESWLRWRAAVLMSVIGHGYHSSGYAIGRECRPGTPVPHSTCCGEVPAEDVARVSHP